MKSKIALKLAEIGRKVSVKSPLIFTGLAVSGVLVTMYVMYKDAPKIQDIIEDAKEDMKMTGPDDKEAKREVRRTFVKAIVPASARVAIAGGSTITFIVLAHRASNKQLAAVVAAYNLYKQSYNEFIDKTNEIVGEKKTSQIQEAIAKDHFEAAKSEDVQETGLGDVVCLDRFSGQKFKASPEAIDRIVNKLNYRLRSEMYIPVNDYYSELHIRRCDCGDRNGWNVDDGEIYVKKVAQLDETDRPYLELSYDVSPQFNYGSLL